MTTAVTVSSDPCPLVTLDEQSHIYTHVLGHQVPSVTSILRTVDPWRSMFDRVAPDALEYARNRGTQVHRATHYLDEGDLDEASVDPAIVPYVRAWEQFKTEKRFIPLLMETLVYHPTYGYAGTFDRIGTADCGREYAPVLCDIKTGDASMAGPQLAAYLEAWRAMQGDAFPMAVPQHRWSVRLHDTGRYTITEHKSREDFRVFQAALTLYNYTRSQAS